MSDEQINEKTIRAAFGSLSIDPENYEYGDEHTATYALLNGVAPAKNAKLYIPKATATLTVQFPVGTDFLTMTRILDTVQSNIRAQVADLAATL
jgi:hypothetical protein